jgi:hypothetical protein
MCHPLGLLPKPATLPRETRTKTQTSSHSHYRERDTKTQARTHVYACTRTWVHEWMDVHVRMYVCIHVHVSLPVSLVCVLDGHA